MASDIDLSSLTSSLSFWEAVGYITFTAVVIGVAGEVIHDFVPALRRKSGWWDSKGGKLSGWVLVIALAAELTAQVKTNSISGQIIAFLGEKTAQAQVDLKRLENPRLIGQSQADAMAANLKPFAGTRFWITTERADQDWGAEQARLSRRLSDIFVSAGWKKDSHLSTDRTIEEPEFVAISDRGCNAASAFSGHALRKLVIDTLRMGDLDCDEGEAPGFIPNAVVIDVGLH